MPYKDPERRRQFHADRYAANSEAVKAKATASYAANRPKRLAAMKKRWADMTPEQREAERARGKRHRQANPRSVQSSNLKWKYGITAEERDAMAAAQRHCCAICGIPEEYATRGRLAVDHDHRTGAVRGLLCDNCNKALGCFSDSGASLAKAIEYLLKYGAKA